MFVTFSNTYHYSTFTVPDSVVGLLSSVLAPQFSVVQSSHPRTIARTGILRK